MGREPKNDFILIRECFLSNLEPLVYTHKRRFSLGDLPTRYRKMIRLPKGGKFSQAIYTSESRGSTY